MEVTFVSRETQNVSLKGLVGKAKTNLIDKGDNLSCSLKSEANYFTIFYYSLFPTKEVKKDRNYECLLIKDYEKGDQ